MKLQSNNRKQHVLQNMHHDHDSRRKQLRPHTEIILPLARDVDLPAKPNQPPDYPPRDKLTRPRNERGIERAAKIVVLASLLFALIRHGISVEREVGIYVFVRAVMENQDGAEEGEHGDGLGEGADVNVAGAELLVRRE